MLLGFLDFPQNLLLYWILGLVNIYDFGALALPEFPVSRYARRVSADMIHVTKYKSIGTATCTRWHLPFFAPYCEEN
jgi:hypothetical protein